jgi:hypothetical protein
MRFLSSVILLAVLSTTAMAQPWYARGSFNGWTTDNPMTDQGGGHYTANITGLFDDAPFMWKIADANWTGSTTHPNSDARVYTNALGEINYHLYDQTSWDDGWYPNNARRVGYDDPQQFDWEIVGSFNGWSNTHDANYKLTPQGNGVYSGTFAMNAGIYDFKFRGVEANLADAWDITIGNDFGNGAGNNTFPVTSNGDEWTFELDLPNGRFRYFTDAAPPGQDGDYNESGFVDAADYTVWRDNLGSTTALPNDPNGAPVGSASYETWKAHFGQGAALSWLARSPQLADQQLVSAGGGAYELDMTGLTAGSDYEFQVVRSNLTSTAPGSNVKVRANASGEIGLKFYELESGTWGDGWSPDSAHRVGYDDHEQFDWEVIGSFDGWANPLLALTDQGNGLHTGMIAIAAPGSYEFKFRQQGDWGTSIGNDFGNSAGNIVLATTNPNEVWHFELDLPNGRWRTYMDVAGAGSLSAVPEPGSLVILMLGLVCGAAAGRRR